MPRRRISDVVLKNMLKVTLIYTIKNKQEVLSTHLPVILPARKHLWCNICQRPRCWFGPWMQYWRLFQYDKWLFLSKLTQTCQGTTLRNLTNNLGDPKSHILSRGAGLPSKRTFSSFKSLWHICWKAAKMIATFKHIFRSHSHYLKNHTALSTTKQDVNCKLLDAQLI